jgi:Flp pilus assembly pilin Flp
MIRMLRRLVADESGQDLVEYAILAALLATVMIAACSLLGLEIEKLFKRVIDVYPPA